MTLKFLYPLYLVAVHVITSMKLIYFGYIKFGPAHHCANLAYEGGNNIVLNFKCHYCETIQHLVEAEVALEDGITEPDFTEGVEESLIVIVSNSSSVLNLTKHVANTRPHHAL